jgi:predicted lipid-binding transport protein (Tim44 family)
MTSDYMLNLNYITDASGNQIAVQIPMSDWLLFQKEYQEIKRKLEVLAGIKEALNEVQQAYKKNQKLQTLTEFLNEC